MDKIAEYSLSPFVRCGATSRLHPGQPFHDPRLPACLALCEEELGAVCFRRKLVGSRCRSMRDCGRICSRAPLGDLPYPNGDRLVYVSRPTRPSSKSRHARIHSDPRRLVPSACGKKALSLEVESPPRQHFVPGRSLRYKYYLDDYPVMELSHMWMDTQGATKMTYVVQTSEKVLQRCLLMTTDPGDLVFDPTCGAGTTALAAEHWGRRWITCDTSRVALALAKQRVMCAVFPYFQLAHPEEGVQSGFNYKTAAHITLGSLTGEEPSAAETLYDQPLLDTTKARVSGPFTVEAVPAPAVRSIDDITEVESQPADEAVARMGETQRQADWRDELYKSGIRAKGGQRIAFSRVEPMAGTRWLHADAETKDVPAQRVAISFGPEHAPLEQAPCFACDRRSPVFSAVPKDHSLRRLPIRCRSRKGH